MKVRITVLTENDKHSDEVTEKMVQKAWQALLDMMMLYNCDPSENAIVEKVEIIEK